MHVVLGMLAALDIVVKLSAAGIDQTVMHKQVPPLKVMEHKWDGRSKRGRWRQKKEARIL